MINEWLTPLIEWTGLPLVGLLLFIACILLGVLVIKK